MNHPSCFMAQARISVYLFVVIGLVFVAVSTSNSSAGQDQVNRFLDLVLKASSLEQVGRAFDREDFSAAEVKRIEAELSKPVFRNKLAGLKPKLAPIEINKIESSGKAPDSRVKSAATGSLKRAKAAPKMPARVPSISPRDLHALTSRPGGGTDARISRVNPSSVRVGQALAISGSGFGGRRGSVEILLSDHRYVCELESWSNTEIRAAVPEYMVSVIGERERDVILWVKLAGQDLGPTFELHLQPAPKTVALPAVDTVQAAAIVEMEISTYVELDGSMSVARTKTFEICSSNQLANGWRIVSARLEKVRGSGNYEYIMEPRAGTSELRQVIRLNTSAFSVLRVASRMIISGPKGKSY